ncbi:hypothetical protein NXF25_019152, partial [Crotalus adamanteus]
LHFLPGGGDFLADTLSRLPQYNSTRENVVNSIIPSNQIVGPAVTRVQDKIKPNITNDLTQSLKTALAGNNWFACHKEDVTVHNGLTWFGTKLYVPTSQRPLILQRSHDSKT